MSKLIGRLLAGRYRIEENIGEGGMARVYRAWDTKRAAPLALKLLREDLSQDPVFLRRFRREAQTLERLQHPNIVRTYGLDQDDLLAFIVMDLVEGHSLRTEIFRQQGQPFTPERLLQVTRPVISALHYAHHLGMAHCDVKPANILIDTSGRVLLSDFGVARLTDSAATLTMMSSGTPAYMAPEQILGLELSPATDIYSLGILLYEILTGGERPFTGERASTTGSTAEKVRWEHLNMAPPSIRSLNPDISPALEKVVWKCLEKEPERRYTSALHLLEAVEGAIRAPEMLAIEAEVSLPEYPSPVLITQTDIEKTAQERLVIRKPGITSRVTRSLPRSRRSFALTAAAGLLLVLNWFVGQMPKP